MPKNNRVLVLFDVDGTLTVARKASAHMAVKAYTFHLQARLYTKVSLNSHSACFFRKQSRKYFKCWRNCARSFLAHGCLFKPKRMRYLWVEWSVCFFVLMTFFVRCKNFFELTSFLAHSVWSSGLLADQISKSKRNNLARYRCVRRIHIWLNLVLLHVAPKKK